MKRFLLAAVLALFAHGLLFAFVPRLAGDRPIEKPKHLTVTLSADPTASPKPAQETERPVPSAKPVVAEPIATADVVKEDFSKEEAPKSLKQMVPRQTETPKPLSKVKTEVKPPKRETASPSKKETSEKEERIESSPLTDIPPHQEEKEAPVGLSADVPGPTGGGVPAAEGKPASVPVAEDIIRAVPAYQNNPPPEYPKMARRRGYEGTVVLEVLVNRDGKVKDLRMLKSSGYDILDSAAEESVREWVFEPGSVGGRKVDMWVRVPVRFELKQN